MQTIISRGLSATSLYKLLFIGLLIPIFIFSLACGIASFYGYSTVTFNNQHLYGYKGLIGGAMIGIVLPILMASLLWCLVAFGIWVWTRVKTITLLIKE